MTTKWTAADIIRLNLTGLTLSPFSGVSKESNSSPGSSGRGSQLAHPRSPQWQGETIRLRTRPNTAKDQKHTEMARSKACHPIPPISSASTSHLRQRKTGHWLAPPNTATYDLWQFSSSFHNPTNPQDSEAHGQDASSSLSLLMRPTIPRTPQLNLSGLTLGLFQESGVRKEAKSLGSSGRGSQLLHPRSRPQWQGEAMRPSTRPTARESRHTPRWNDPIQVDGSLIQKANYPLKQGLDSMCHWRRLGCSNVTSDSKSAAQMKRET